MFIPLIFFLAATFSQRATAQETVKEELLKAQGLVKQGQGAEASAILIKIMQKQPNNKKAVQCDKRLGKTNILNTVIDISQLLKHTKSTH